MADSVCHPNDSSFCVEVTALLSESTQIKVFKAKLTDWKDFVAVKTPFLDRDEGQCRQNVEVITRAMKKMLCFDHSNIVRHVQHQVGLLLPSISYRFTGLEQELCQFPQYQIIMEYCAGGTLHDLLRKPFPVTAPLLQKWTRQLVDGLAYLHGQRYAHKDLRTDHIFLSSSEVDTGVLKIGGFGRVKQLLPNTTSSRYCGEVSDRSSSCVFMSPEMIVGSDAEIEPEGESEKPGRRSDIWSLGCVLIHMATGTLPKFYKATLNGAKAITGELAIVYYVGSGGSPMVPGGIPEVLKDLIVQCLTRNPNDRPTSESLKQHPFLAVPHKEMEKWTLQSYNQN